MIKFKKVIRAEDFVRFFVYVSLLISALPVVDLYCPWYVSLVPIMVLFLWAVSKNGQSLYTIVQIVGTIVLASAIECYLVYRDARFLDFLINRTIAFMPCCFAVLLRENLEDRSFFGRYVQMLIILMTVTSVTTIIGLNQHPTAARELASGDALFDVEKYYRANIGGYDFIYALVIVAPVMLWMIRRTKGFMRLVNIFALVAAITCVIKSQYTIALITLALSIAIALIRTNKTIGFFLTVGVLLFLLTGGLNQLGEFFRWLSTKVEYDYVADRLLQVAQFLQGQVVSTDTSSRRIDYYIHAFDLLKKRPIFGWNLISFSKANVSGHTLILDLLSGGGILGLSLYVLPIRSLYKKALHNIQKPASDTSKATWIVFVMVACLNPVGYSLILTIPFTALMCVNETERTRIDKGEDVDEKS